MKWFAFLAFLVALGVSLICHVVLLDQLGYLVPSDVLDALPHNRERGVRGVLPLYFVFGAIMDAVSLILARMKPLAPLVVAVLSCIASFCAFDSLCIAVTISRTMLTYIAAFLMDVAKALQSFRDMARWFRERCRRDGAAYRFWDSLSQFGRANAAVIDLTGDENPAALPPFGNMPGLRHIDVPRPAQGPAPIFRPAQGW